MRQLGAQCLSSEYAGTNKATAVSCVVGNNIDDVVRVLKAKGVKNSACACSSLRTLLVALACALWLVTGCDKHPGPAPQSAASGVASAPAVAAGVVQALPSGFRSASAEVNGTTLHYVMGGQGPAVLLIHGFPEDWSAFATIMPGLASKFRLVAVDLRGIGGSVPVHGDHETATMAEDIYQLARKLELDRAYVVGHDIGGGIAYAVARLHPDAIRGAVILDVPIPGVDPWDRIKVDPALWHFGFHRAPGLAEKLLAGREAVYFDYFLRDNVADPKSISDEAIARCARAYSQPGQMAAAMNMYRATGGEKFGKERRGPLKVPLVLVGGAVSKKGFGELLPAIAKGLKDAGAKSVAVETIAGAGHYVVDEKPAQVAALIGRYAAAKPPNRLRRKTCC
jgi:pimeloyl-ACP methyl ester carboxylesterase